MDNDGSAENNNHTPEVFISNSWSSDEYIEWVRQLAEEISQYNTIVHLDQWELLPGDDKFVYMEKMVNDPKIEKVIVLCDRKYKEKADDREGGVGTEATIMTPKVYEEVRAATGTKNFCL